MLGPSPRTMGPLERKGKGRSCKAPEVAGNPDGVLPDALEKERGSSQML